MLLCCGLLFWCVMCVVCLFVVGCLVLWLSYVFI